MWRLNLVLSLVFGLWLLPVEARAGDLKALSFQEFPAGVYTAVVLNGSTEPTSFSVSRLVSAVDGSPVHIWWNWSSSEVLAPGAHGVLRFALKRAKSRQDAVKAYFDTGEPLALYRQDSDLLPVHIVRDASSGDLYVYLRNRGAQSVTVSGLALEDATLGSAEKAPLEIAAGEIGLWHAKPSSWDTRYLHSNHVLSMSVDGVTTYTAVRVFDSSGYSLLWESEAEESIACPTHQLGPWDGVGERLFNRASRGGTSPQAVHFCRNRLPDGLAAFGQCAPRAIVNLQASNLNRGEGNPWPGWFDIAGIVKAATEPGIFTALIEDASQYSGAYGQPASPTDTPLGSTEVRPLLYSSLAAGSKGLLLRRAFGQNPAESSSPQDSATSSGPPGPSDRAKFDEPLAELRKLLPWLAVSEPVPHAVSTSDQETRVLALLCGSKGMLIVALHTGSGGYPRSLEVQVERPPGSPALARCRDLDTGLIKELDSASISFSINVTMNSNLQLLRLEPVATPTQ